MLEPLTKMIDGLKAYAAASMRAGINVNSSDITVGPEAIDSLPFGENTYNFSAGRQAGWTSRYGIHPVPGHNSNENGALITTGVMAGYSMRNLVAAEQTQAAHTTVGYDVYDKRKFLYGAAIVQLPVGVGNKLVPVVYWISSRTAGGNQQIDLLPSTDIITSGQKMGIRSHLEGGVGGGGAVLSYVGGATEVNRTLLAIDRLHTTGLANLRKIPNTFPKYLRFTVLQAKIQTSLSDFIGAQTPTVPDPGGIPRDAYFNMAGNPYWNNGRAQKRAMGFDVSLSGSVGLLTAPEKWTAKGYFSDVVGDLTGVAASNRSQTSTANAFGGRLNFSAVSTATYANSGAYPILGSAYLFIRVDDQPTTVPTTIIAMVTDRPLIALLNPLLRDSTENDTTSTAASPPPAGNDFVQWIDPTANLWTPRRYNTRNTTIIANPYTEVQAIGGVAIARQTCWQNAPLFVFGTGTVNVFTGQGGQLLQDRVYEYAYSIYNALTGKESNVGDPARAYVSGAQNNSIIRVQQSMNPLMFGAQTNATQFPAFTEMFGEASAAVQAAIPINFLSYRVYFREVGSAEWLFNGEYSFSSIYFEPFAPQVQIGRTAVVGEVGGQPGFYNDYSDLPVDDYIDVVAFQDRLFWLTKKCVRFSTLADKFSYPTRNIGVPTQGEFRGMIPHFFTGQALQNGRLVIFGSEEQFECRFTGQLQQEQVRVSSSALPQAVTVEGSDFNLAVRSSDTAFSGRAAVVAEGILYYMGPTGIFRDDGVNMPRRISQAIEPLYFDGYDKTATGEFFAYYNKRSREVLFFYRPSANNPTANPNGYLTKAWVYSVRTEFFVTSSIAQQNNVIGAWSQYGYSSLIDWSQTLNVTDFETQAHEPGTRALIGVREAQSSPVSRPYYHDDDCDGGDYKPGSEVMVKEIQRPDATTVRLILAAGYSTTIVNNLVAGTTQIAVKESSGYGDMPVNLNVDGFYVVKGRDATAGYIDLTVSGNLGSITAKTFTVFQYFPVFVEGFHDVVCVLEPNYLCPEGLAQWIMVRYLHVLIKPVPKTQGTATPVFTAQWNPNHEISAVVSSKTLPLYAMNTRETTTQILADIPSSDMQAEGQAIKSTLTYNQIAGRWTLYAMTHYYESKGPSEVKYYTRLNG